jgi:hypothetical protein
LSLFASASGIFLTSNWAIHQSAITAIIRQPDF